MTAVREPAAASAVVEAAAAAWWYSGVGLWLFMKCLFLAPRGSHFGAVGAALQGQWAWTGWERAAPFLTPSDGKSLDATASPPEQALSNATNLAMAVTGL